MSKDQRKPPSFQKQQPPASPRKQTPVFVPNNKSESTKRNDPLGGTSEFQELAPKPRPK